MDAITMLKQDHKRVRDLFKKFEAAGETAYKTKGRLVEQMIRELSIHADVEEEVFYPATREWVEQADDDVLEALEEHHIVKWTLSELEDMHPREERFDAKVTVLIESVRHHMKEEEEEMFPMVRKAMGRGALAELGEQMEKVRSSSSGHPHPRMPDQPPGNIVAAPIVKAVDIGKNVMKSVHEERDGA
jgi:hemerythrin superfamily protein